MTIELRPLHGDFGVEILNVDISAGLDDSEFASDGDGDGDDDGDGDGDGKKDGDKKDGDKKDGDKKDGDK